MGNAADATRVQYNLLMSSLTASL